MSRVYLNDYLDNLHSQIAASVDRLKNRAPTSQKFSAQSDQNNEVRTDSSSLSPYAYHLLETGVSYHLASYSGQNMTEQDAGYVAGSYLHASQMNQEPSIMIDFMFKYNREFDFKV